MFFKFLVYSDNTPRQLLYVISLLEGGWGQSSPLASQFRRPWLHSIIQGGLQFDQCRSNEIFIFHAPEDYTQKLHVNACCCGLGIYGKIYILLHSGLNSAWQLLLTAIFLLFEMKSVENNFKDFFRSYHLSAQICMYPKNWHY